MTHDSYILLLIAVGFCVLIIVEHLGWTRRSRHLPDILSGKGNTQTFLIKQVAGCFLLLVVVLLSGVFSAGAEWFGAVSGKTFWVLLFGLLSLLSFLLGWFGAPRYVTNLKSHAPICPISGRFASAHLLVRTLFLLAYEFFFRGIMLASFMEKLRLPDAILLNTALYSLAHVYSRPRDIAGSVPLGILLCILTIELRSVWPAVIIHFLLALTFETRIIFLTRSPLKTAQL
jgi:membrane protease YdiL (CAAX protease family)